MHEPDIQVGQFPSGHMVTCGLQEAPERTILFVNAYVTHLAQIEDDELLPGKLLDALFTKASIIMIESYLVPMLLKEGSVQEMQLELRTRSGGKHPVVVNAQRCKYNPELVYWSLFSASQRDKLYHELILARRAIEEKARELTKLATTDSLTGLLNRREIIRRTEFLFSYNRRLSNPACLIILDIDHFKKINDQYGHDVGDKVIKAVAEALRSSSRESDMVGRFGGEEFVLILPDTPHRSALSAAHRVQDKLKGIDCIDRPVTASMGIAIQHFDGRTFKELFSAADKALYAAKHSGRNRFVFASKPHVLGKPRSNSAAGDA